MQCLCSYMIVPYVNLSEMVDCDVKLNSYLVKQVSENIFHCVMSS